MMDGATVQVPQMVLAHRKVALEAAVALPRKAMTLGHLTKMTTVGAMVPLNQMVLEVQLDSEAQVDGPSSENEKFMYASVSQRDMHH